MKNRINKKFKIMFIVIALLIITTGCNVSGNFKHFKVAGQTVSPSFVGSELVYVADKNLDDVSIVVHVKENVGSVVIEQERLNKKKNPTLIKQNVSYIENIPAPTFETDKEIKINSLKKDYIYKFTITFKEYSTSKKLDTTTVYLYTYNSSSSSSSSNSTQSIQTGVEKELLNKIGGISQYCNYDETLHYNELPSSANMFSKIAYSQVNCATTKYSSSYDNGISFINWVFEKNGASTRLPSTYNEVITWAGGKIFTAGEEGTNIQAGDLVILGNDSTSPIEIVVQVNSNRIKTVGYKTSGNNKVIYETSHNDMLNGKRIIKMNGISY